MVWKFSGLCQNCPGISTWFESGQFQNCPDISRWYKNYPDGLKFSGFFQIISSFSRRFQTKCCPNFSRLFQIFQTVSKLYEVFQMILIFLGSFITVNIFLDDLKFFGRDSNYLDNSTWFQNILDGIKLSGYFQVTWAWAWGSYFNWEEVWTSFRGETSPGQDWLTTKLVAGHLNVVFISDRYM